MYRIAGWAYSTGGVIAFDLQRREAKRHKWVMTSPPHGGENELRYYLR